MKRVGVILLGLLILIGCLTALVKDRIADSLNCPGLIVHCAAGLQKPVEEIAREFEKETGISVHLNLGGSGQLYSQLSLVGGDVYIPADMSYLEKAQDEGLIDEAVRFSTLLAELIVAEGNPKKIISLEDLARDNVRVVIAERSAAVGLFTHEVIEKSGLLGDIEDGDLTKMGTVNEVALQVQLGAADVGIVWNALEFQFENCEFISVPAFQKQAKYAGVGNLKSGKWPEETSAFISYLIDLDKGGKVFKKYGFDGMDTITR